MLNLSVSKHIFVHKMTNILASIPLMNLSPSLLGLQAAHMEEPGAIIFGFRTSPVSKSALFTSGPLDEYDATTGACPV